MLTLYNASAGSGKTYTLTQLYLELALKGAGHDAFKNILAVTFTKKATAEIKDRILKELYKLIEHPEEARGPVRPYVENASLVFKRILHQYDYLQISTIDSFFQRILRGFARELNLNHNFVLELDQALIIEQALDRLYQRIGTDENVTELLVQWAMENADEGKSWDFRRGLAEFAAEAFKEEYRRHPAQAETVNFREVKKTLKSRMRDIEYELLAGCDSAQAAIEYCPDIKLLSYGESGPAGYPEKLRKRIDEQDVEKWTDVTRESLLDEGLWKSKKDPEPEYVGNIRSAIILLKELAGRLVREYTTLMLINDNLISSLLLNEVLVEVQNIRTHDNVFLLSEGNYFLQEITENAEAPFIYERIGTQLQHFFIDEMQDTSRTQYEAIRPLLQNAVGEGHGSVMVGDVKQAIYRWRGGDLNLMMGQVEKDFGGVQAISRKTLSENWRSGGQIITFNNQIFEQLRPRIELMLVENLVANQVLEDQPTGIALQAEVIGLAFAESFQQIPVSRDAVGKGIVRASFVLGPKKREDGDETTPTQADNLKELLYQNLQEVMRLGHAPGDMCLLVRRKSEGQKLAEWLEEFAVRAEEDGIASWFKSDFTSADSLTLNASAIVRVLVGLLKYIHTPTDRLVQADLLYEYHVNVLAAADPDLHQLFMLPKGLENEQAFLSRLPVPFGAMLPTLGSKGLFEITEMLIECFFGDLAPGQSRKALQDEAAFVMAFSDLVLAYQHANGSVLGRFLEYYETNGPKKYLDLPGARDRITIMTVHKSKGLEFPVVIMPFCDWSLADAANHKKYLWLAADEHIHNLRKAAITYGKKLVVSHYADEYVTEYIAQHLDNLNLLYVALTRPRNALYLYAPHPGFDTKGREREKFKAEDFSNVGGALYYALSQQGPDIISKDDLAYVFETGQLENPEPENSPTPPIDKVQARFGYAEWNHLLRTEDDESVWLAEWDPVTRAAPDAFIIRFLLMRVRGGQVPQADRQRVVREGWCVAEHLDVLLKQIETLIARPELAPHFGVGLVRVRPTYVFAGGITFNPERVLTSDGQAHVLRICNSMAPSKPFMQPAGLMQVMEVHNLTLVALDTIYLPSMTVIPAQA